MWLGLTTNFAIRPSGRFLFLILIISIPPYIKIFAQQFLVHVEVQLVI